MDTKTMFTTHKLMLCAAVVASLAGSAQAGPRLPGSEHSPPRFVDEPSNAIGLTRRLEGKVEGYGFHFMTLIAGATNENDRARLDWKQGGKALASVKCPLSIHAGAVAYVECEYRDKPLTAKGTIDADLIYIDDSDNQEYLLRSYKFTVARYPAFGDAVWQVVPDDLLAGAWVRHRFPQEIRNSTAGRPQFYFWIAGELRSKMTMRCTVDGAKLPDIKLSGEFGDAHAIEATTQPRTGNGVHYVWTEVEATMDVNFGFKADYGGAANDFNGVFLGDHPGAWVCLVRNDGDALRELAFTVTDKGFITSELQTAKGAPVTFDNVSAVELRFPKGAKGDGRIRPDAMKKSRGFGLSWPDAPSVKSIQATFPAASGWPDPK
jgi:hypothetical protein